MINWSYLSRGNVALTKTNKKQKRQVLSPKQIACKFIKVSFTYNSGKWYPPRNKIADKVDNKTIELYSAKKKNTKGTEECSVKNPATNSDSIKKKGISL